MYDFGEQNENIEKKSSEHIPSTVLPDTLFTFTTELQWMASSLRAKMLSPRYCEEDYKYLKIKGFERLAIPMKCFCDINLHKLGIHMQWYGYYGLAFSKDWGMKRKIQPVQYINPDSELRKDFTEAFSDALRGVNSPESIQYAKLKDFLLHELMYYKPYQGETIQRTTNKKRRKCFSDECEWRFIPKVSNPNTPQTIPQELLIGDVSKEYSDLLDGDLEVSLAYEYEDLKYVIVRTRQDHYELMSEIDSWGLNQVEKYALLSKIIIWENLEGDF